MITQTTLTIRTPGRGTQEITAKVNQLVQESGINQGVCHVFVMHTSASLMLCENADPSVRSDLETFMQNTVPDGDPMFEHTLEGPDDMPAHVRTVLTDSSLSVPVNNGHCVLGEPGRVFTCGSIAPMGICLLYTSDAADD